MKMAVTEYVRAAGGGCSGSNWGRGGVRREEVDYLRLVPGSSKEQFYYLSSCIISMNVF